MITEDITDVELEKLYFELGWSKKLMVEWVVFNQREDTPYLWAYEFKADTLTCTANEGDDAQYQMTFIQQLPTGVYWSCGVCGKTYGPLAWEDGRLQSKTKITKTEAWEQLQKTGQHPPIGMGRPQRQRGQIIRTR